MILLSHRFIKNPDQNLWRRSYEGAPCLYYRTDEQLRGDITNYKNDVFTIDDAHHSVYDIAYPIFKQTNKKFILFVPTALIGTPKFCSWEQIKEMSDLAEIGSHGHNHLPFDTLTPDKLETELRMSFRAIKEHTGVSPRYVSCPASRRIPKEVVQKCGFEDIRFNLGQVKCMVNRI